MSKTCHYVIQTVFSHATELNKNSNIKLNANKIDTNVCYESVHIFD